MFKGLQWKDKPLTEKQINIIVLFKRFCIDSATDPRSSVLPLGFEPIKEDQLPERRPTT